MKHNAKKCLSLLLVTLVMMTAITVQPFSVQAAESIDIEAESAILVDFETGKIVYAKNPDMALPPASMTKMMTEYLVHEAIAEGQISWDTTTQISDYPYSISADASFSGVGLTQDKDYTVKQLYDAMAINSDNATTIALAELIAGSEGEFVKMMNEKAEEMGLPEYEFVNSTGLANSSLGENVPEGTDPDANNLLSARSAALLAYNLINDYPEALEVSKVPSAEFDDQTIRNWNWMLPHDEEDASSLQQFNYEGIDGLKTGFTELAGHCFTGTAERNGKRFVSVVMKTEGQGARFEETAKLMDYGFNQFENQEIFPAGYQLEGESDIPVSKGKEDTVQVATNEAFMTPVNGDQAENYSIEYQLNEDKLNEDGELNAPIEKGEKIGTAKVVYSGEEDDGYISPESDKRTIDLVAQDTVEKDNWFMLTIGAIGGFFGNIFSTVVDTVKGWF
ncbi:D-Ala-D-Ala carboxypeptidase A. Serine peptidase. MEROPS family S11 [Lentibacillus halodurans]|uniref:serine-type D-Ala-D-Ala carboxypeptidase n=1 Tax=Lentibacillus halodurans TaxID=237679 RepID=A0A1I0ZZ54_9BACI|nr:serine hydrolase [Lentibacillus halodurans]SFB29680.1 D-Ala-D-Ala carboxypeptidase A. Serine peptidase. MEROPS family S11 [Lentibacillus halodurans]